MKQVILAVIGIGMLMRVNAQNGSLSGVITLSDSTSAIQGVSIYLEGTDWGTTSKSDGHYTIQNIPAGKYTVVYSSIGFIPVESDITIGNNASQQQDVILRESIEELSAISVMTKGSNNLKNMPGSVQYITPKELARFGYTDATRTLRLAPGINIREEDGFGLRPNIGLRGTGVERSSKITLMEDGILSAPAPYAEPSAYYFPTMGRMHGVEILKGSSQIKYGPYTTGGAINFISTPIPEYLSAHVNMSAGNFGMRNLHAFAGDALEHVGYIFETFQYGSTGFKELDNGGNTGFVKSDYIGKLRFNTSKDAKMYQSLTLKAGQTTENSNETYLGLTHSDFESTPYRRYAASQLDNMQSTQQQYSATHIIQLNDRMHLTTSVYYTQFKRNWYKLNNVTDSAGTKYALIDVIQNPTVYTDAYAILTGADSYRTDALTIRANNRKYYAMGVQTEASYSIKKGIWSHNIVGGLRVHEDGVDRLQWDDKYAMVDGSMSLSTAGTPGSESNRVRTADALAGYVQYQLSRRNITVVPGVRVEHINLLEKDYGNANPDRIAPALTTTENTITAIVPGIGFDLAMQVNTHIFGGVHKGFGPPGVSPDTKPEESTNYELGYRYNKNALHVEGTVFANDYTNLLGADMTSTGGTGTGDMFNAGAVLTTGVEMLISHDLMSIWHINKVSVPVAIAYTFTNSRFKNDFEATYADWGTVESGDLFPYQAAHQLNVVAACSYEKFTVNMSANYLSDMRIAPGQGPVDASEIIPARTVVDGNITYTVNPNWRFYFNCMNMLNAVYLVSDKPAGYRPGLPRTISAGMRLDI